jgi:hypothetical protein
MTMLEKAAAASLWPHLSEKSRAQAWSCLRDSVQEVAIMQVRAVLAAIRDLDDAAADADVLGQVAWCKASPVGSSDLPAGEFHRRSSRAGFAAAIDAILQEKP